MIIADNHKGAGLMQQYMFIVRKDTIEMLFIREKK